MGLSTPQQPTLCPDLYQMYNISKAKRFPDIHTYWKEAESG
jgi:hypothetical protein